MESDVNEVLVYELITVSQGVEIIGRGSTASDAARDVRRERGLVPGVVDGRPRLDHSPKTIGRVSLVVHDGDLGEIIDAERRRHLVGVRKDDVESGALKQDFDAQKGANVALGSHVDVERIHFVDRETARPIAGSNVQFADGKMLVHIDAGPMVG